MEEAKAGRPQAEITASFFPSTCKRVREAARNHHKIRRKGAPAWFTKGVATADKSAMTTKARSTARCRAIVRSARVQDRPVVVPRDKLRLASPESAAGTYTFNKHAIRHRFCLSAAFMRTPRRRSRGNPPPQSICAHRRARLAAFRKDVRRVRCSRRPAQRMSTKPVHPALLSTRQPRRSGRCWAERREGY